MKRNALVAACAIAVLGVLLVGLPWIQAYWDYSSGSGYLWTEEGNKIQFVYVDKTHFDAYKTALWCDKSLSITAHNGALFCNDEKIRFPHGKNVALVCAPNDILFVELDGDYLIERGGGGGVTYIFGEMPHFKKQYKGMIDLSKVKNDEVIKDEWSLFILSCSQSDDKE